MTMQDIVVDTRTAGSERNGVRTRPVTKDDMAEVCRLLSKHFPPHPPESVWEPLFNYPWKRTRPEYGWALEDQGKIVGFLATIYAERMIGGRPVEVCCLSSLCVDKKYRLRFTQMFVDAIRDRSVVYTSLTPMPQIAAALKRLGFRTLDHGKLAFPPLLNVRTLRAGRPQIDYDVERFRAELSEPQRRILDDHAGNDCDFLLARHGTATCFMAAKRRLNWRRMPRSEILYVSNPAFLARHLEPIKLSLLRRHRALSLVVDHRLFGEAAPVGFFMRYPCLFRGEGVEPEQIDNLYSELTILGI